MSDLDDIEAKLNKVKEAREIEQAVDHCQRGVLNEGVIYKIAAESDYGTQRGGAERSINIVLTIGESASVFAHVEKLLSERLSRIKGDLGL